MHNTTVTVGGVTLARVIEIINDYVVEFEDGQYAVNLIGANSNVADRTVVNQVSVRAANSAGLVVADGSGRTSLTPAEIWSYGNRSLTVAPTYNGPSVSSIADAVRSELTPELGHIMSLQNGLTSYQATMLLEMYRLLGLDPTRPLVVTQTNRSAGAEINQTITGNESVTTVTRV